MSHPCLYFIRYLLCVGRTEDHDAKWVGDTLRLQGLYTVRDDLLAEIRSGMDFPKPFLPSNPEHKESMEFLERMGVKDMFYPTPEVAKATAILQQQALRENVEVALLGRIPHREIAGRMNTRFGCSLGEEDLASYEHFYYNVPLLSMTGWSEFLAEHQEDEYDRRVALHCGSNMALHRLGFKTTLESKQVLRKVQQQLYFRLVDLDRFPTTPDVVRMENALSRTLLSVDERLRESDLALKEVMDQFKRFQMERDNEKVADAHQLSSRGSLSGALTGSVATEEDAG